MRAEVDMMQHLPPEVLPSSPQHCIDPLQAGAMSMGTFGYSQPGSPQGWRPGTLYTHVSCYPGLLA